MILGIGCDVLHIDRISKLIKYKLFLEKYFTEKEVDMFNKYKKNKKNYEKKIASNFCVKEAFFKALSSKIDSFKFSSVEVLRDDFGKPYINLYDNLYKFSETCNLHVTISNEENIVTSFVLIENKF